MDIAASAWVSRVGSPNAPPGAPGDRLHQPAANAHVTSFVRKIVSTVQCIYSIDSLFTNMIISSAVRGKEMDV